MKTVNLFLAAISCLMLGAIPPYLIKQCIDSLPGDSFSFGYAIATHDKYLVVGDPLGANHVVIYTRDRDGKWLRTREILPPKDSTAYKVSSGFGHTLALVRDNLIIGTFTVIDPENDELVNPKDFQENNGIVSTSTALYQTKLDRETEVKRIDLPNVPTKGAITPGSIVADNGKIAFIFFRQQHRKRINQVYILSNSKLQALPSDKLEYRLPSKAIVTSIYGSDIALKNNLLLVGIDRAKNRGGAWLFDLNSPQNKPHQLTIPYAKPALISVAISEQFIAIGNTFTSIYRDLSKPSQATLIMNIATGSTKIIDGAGELSLGSNLSLDSNILARIQSISDEHEDPKLLEVFRLDDELTPHLIKKRNDVERALVQNKLLITVQKTTSGKRICTEQVR